MYRQGDVLIIPHRAAPDGAAIEAEPYADRVILAYGEKTGHMHQVKSRSAEVARSSGGARFLTLKEPGELVHDEHAPISLPSGTHEVRQQREFTGEQERTRTRAYAD